MSKDEDDDEEEEKIVLENRKHVSLRNQRRKTLLSLKKHTRRLQQLHPFFGSSWPGFGEFFFLSLIYVMIFSSYDICLLATNVKEKSSIL